MKKRDHFLQPLLNLIPDFITPNMLSVLRLMLSIPLFILLLIGNFGTGFALFLFTMILDFIDGPLARKRKAISTIGIAIDPLADKVVLAAVFIPIGVLFLPVNLFLTITIFELVILIGSLTHASVVWLRYKEVSVIPASTSGQFKMMLYAIATTFLFVGFYIAQEELLIQISILIFWAAALFALISAIQYLVRLGVPRSKQQAHQKSHEQDQT